MKPFRWNKPVDRHMNVCHLALEPDPKRAERITIILGVTPGLQYAEHSKKEC